MGFAGLDFGSTVIIISVSLSKVGAFWFAILDSIRGGFSGRGNWILLRSFGFRKLEFFLWILVFGFLYGIGLLFNIFNNKRKLIDTGFYSSLFKGFGIQFFSGRFSGLLDGWGVASSSINFKTKILTSYPPCKSAFPHFLSYVFYALST